MIYTDRKYNNNQTLTRHEQIRRLEEQHDKLADLLYEHPAMCTTENINRLNGLASQIEIMKGNRIINF